MSHFGAPSPRVSLGGGGANASCACVFSPVCTPTIFPSARRRAAAALSNGDLVFENGKSLTHDEIMEKFGLAEEGLGGRLVGLKMKESKTTHTDKMADRSGQLIIEGAIIN